MILVCSQRTQAGALKRLAERGRTLSMELPAPKVQHKPVVAPEPRQRVPEPVRVILGDVVIAMPTRYREHRRIIDLVARMHRSTLKAVLSPTRTRRITTARMAAMCAVKEWETQHGREMTMPHLGRIFGKDHTSILNSFRKRGYQERAR